MTETKWWNPFLGEMAMDLEDAIYESRQFLMRTGRLEVELEEVRPCELDDIDGIDDAIVCGVRTYLECGDFRLPDSALWEADWCPSPEIEKKIAALAKEIALELPISEFAWYPTGKTYLVKAPSPAARVEDDQLDLEAERTTPLKLEDF